jgi:hypothetical protein
MDEEASFAQSQRAMYDQNNRDRGGQLNYRDQHYEHCPICNYNNYAYCEVPCRNSLIFPDDCPKALIVYLPRRDYHYAYRLEVIFEEGAQRNRFYEILRKRNNAGRPNPNDYVTIFPSEALELGYKFTCQGRPLGENNFILKFRPNQKLYIAPRLFKEIKVCRAFRDRMATNRLDM